MEKILLSTEYVLVLDTNSPSYEFASDLCAYCTGFEPENENCFDMLDEFYHDIGVKSDSKTIDKIDKNPFKDYIFDKLNDEGHYSPCSVWLNKKYGCNEFGEFAVIDENNFDQFQLPAPLSVGIFFEKEPTAELLSVVKKRAIVFFDKICKKPVKLEGMRIITKNLYGSEQTVGLDDLTVCR